MPTKLLLILFFATSVCADITVGTPATIATSFTNEAPLLTAPRRNFQVRRGDTLSLWPKTTGSGPGDSSHFWSADEGATWNDVKLQIAATGGVDMHQSSWTAGGTDGVHLVSPDDADYFGYRYVAAPMTQQSDAEALDNLGWSSAVRGAVISRADSVWIAIRVPADDDTLNILHTVDRFATDTTDISQNIGGSTNKRVGLFADDAGLPHLLLLHMSVGIYMLPWQGTGSGFETPGAGNLITTNVGGNEDRVMGVTYSDAFDFVYGNDGATDSLVHYHGSGSSWTKYTVSTGTDAAVTYQPQLTSRNDSVYCFWQVGAEGVYKVFDGSSWSADSVVCTGSDVIDATNGFIDCPYIVPVTMDYIPFAYVTTSDILRYNKLTLSAVPGVSGSVLVDGGVTIQ